MTQKRSFLVVFFLAFLFLPCLSSATDKPSLEVLEEQFRESQARNDPEAMARVLRKMLDNGYKTVARYKQLGDLYFYIKRDEEALDTFREQARWANTSETWENLSDLLIWKKKDREGLQALEKAVGLAPDDERLRLKLALKYEYYRQIEKAETILLDLYEEKGKSTEIGQKVIEFYLRNSLVAAAGKVMDELTEKDPDLSGSRELKLLKMKINTWLSRTEGAFQALQEIDVEDIPDADLEYSFELALYGGNVEYARKILDRLEKLGKRVWKRQLQLSVAIGIPEETRELIEQRIDEEGENVELLTALYETYRAERNLEGEIGTLEKLFETEPGNRRWQDLLMKHYRYNQTLERGIDIFGNVADNHEDAQMARLNLAKLYLANQEYYDFYETIETVTREDLQSWIRDLKQQAAYLQDDQEKIYTATKDILAHTENLAPEELQEEAGAKPDSTPARLPEDKYLDLLVDLSYLAGSLGRPDEKRQFGRKAYLVLKERYRKYPTKKRLRQLLSLGVDYAKVEERRVDFAEGARLFSDTDFYLKKYRFLMKQGDYEEAEEILVSLLASPESIEESYQAAEHTFGFVSYNLSKKLFRNIIARDPNYTMGLKRLGQIALYTENYQEAVFFFRKYLNVNSYDPEAIFDLGEALYFSHQPYDARDEFKRVVELLDYPDRENYETILLAISHLRLEEYKKALELLYDARKRNPENLSIKLNILETLVLMKKWQDAMDLIKEENLDDDKRIDEARKIIFQSNLKTAMGSEGSQLKADLKYQELKAIVDVQLALRVKIILHLCLEGLGRFEEDRILLDELAQNHPGNKNVIATVGFVYLDRGDSSLAMRYLKKAKEMPPDDQLLNQSYRELTSRFHPKVFSSYSFTEKSSAGQKEYTRHKLVAGGQAAVVNMDRLWFSAHMFKSTRYSIESSSTVISTDLFTDARTTTRATYSSQGETISNVYLDFAYLGNIRENFNLPVSQTYEAHIFFQHRTGLNLEYGMHIWKPSINLTLDLYRSAPDHDDFDRVLAGTRYDGFEFEGSFMWKGLRQNYTLQLQQRTFSFENEDYGGNPSQIQATLSFTQFLMTYPSNLELTISYSTVDAEGEQSEFNPETSSTTYKHFIVPSAQTQVDVTYQRYWSEFFNSRISLGALSGQYKRFETDHKTGLEQSISATTLRIGTHYINDRWQISGYLSRYQEQQGEKPEVTTLYQNGTPVTEVETISDSKTIANTEIGLSATLIF